MINNIVSVDDQDFKGKRVLLRVDFNVPLNGRQEVTDHLRIQESLPTIDKIMHDGGIPILLSHLGRPKGQWNKKLSMEIVAEYMEEVFGYNILFAEDCLGESPKKIVNKAMHGDIVMLENLRFYEYETANDKEFAKQLAALGDVYVNDAFGTVHRYHSSIYELPLLFEDRFAGKSLWWEIEYLKNTLSKAESPYVAIVGGAKISDKINVIKKLTEKCDIVMVGGGMMFTFLKAMGYNIGRSIFETEKVQLAKELIDNAKNNNCEIMVPNDVVVADRFHNDADRKIVSVETIPSDWLGLDIGTETRKIFQDVILNAKTVIWNGPMGVFEMSNFAVGTYSIANALARVTAKGALTIIGGGDSGAAIRKMNFMNKVTHVTPGGGAWLKFMEGEGLPGIDALVK